MVPGNDGHDHGYAHLRCLKGSYIQLRRTICTSVTLRASIAVELRIKRCPMVYTPPEGFHAEIRSNAVADASSLTDLKASLAIVPQDAAPAAFDALLQEADAAGSTKPAATESPRDGGTPGHWTLAGARCLQRSKPGAMRGRLRRSNNGFPRAPRAQARFAARLQLGVSASCQRSAEHIAGQKMCVDRAADAHRVRGAPCQRKCAAIFCDVQHPLGSKGPLKCGARRLSCLEAWRSGRRNMAECAPEPASSATEPSGNSNASKRDGGAHGPQSTRTKSAQSRRASFVAE